MTILMWYTFNLFGTIWICLSCHNNYFVSDNSTRTQSNYLISNGLLLLSFKALTGYYVLYDPKFCQTSINGLLSAHQSPNQLFNCDLVVG